MRLARQLWVTACAVAFIPSNLRRGWSLSDQYWIWRIALHVEAA